MKPVSRNHIFNLFLEFKMNRKNRKQQRNVEKKMNNMIRQLCCWNCFQVGHKRFQCPFAKQICCSFCRKPSIRSIECGCELSRQYIGLHNRRPIHEEQQPSYENDVLVPEYKQKDNIVIVVDNTKKQDEEGEEVDNDCLEINADTDSLNDL